MISIEAFERLIPLDNGLTVVVTRRSDQTPHATVVNAGVLPHPLTGELAVGIVVGGRSRKLQHLRADSTITCTVRAGWRWATVEGHATVIGPDDPEPTIDDELLRRLLREIFEAAGGTHDDWAAYDRTMREERRAAVLVTPSRTYTNPA